MLETLQTPVAVVLMGSAAGVLTNIMNKMLHARKDRIDEDRLMRIELKSDLEHLKSEVAALRSQVDEWKEKYFGQVQVSQKLKVDVLRLTNIIDGMRGELTIPEGD